MKQFTSTPSVGFTDAVKSTLNNMTNFSGRTRRSEFWWSILAYSLLVLVFSIVFGIFIPQNATSIISTFLQFLIFGTTVRRLHDSGKSGWWVGASWIVSALGSIYTLTKGSMLFDINTDPQDLMEFVFSPLTLLMLSLQTILSIIVIVFCLLDSDPKTNKYGESPKYKDMDNNPYGGHNADIEAV